MQKVTILCTGKLKEKFYLDAAAEYAKRLSRFCKLDILELPEERLPENPSPAQVEAALSKEADAVRAKLPASCLLIAMCVEGKERSSEELARYLADSAAQGASTNARCQARGWGNARSGSALVMPSKSIMSKSNGLESQ